MPPKKTKPKAKKKSPLYQFIDDVTSLKTPLTGDENQLKDYSPYMMNKTISMAPGYLNAIQVINMYDVPKEVHYEFLKSSLPRRSQFFKNIKAGKSEEKIDNVLAEYFKVGTKDYAEIKKYLPREEIEAIYKGVTGSDKL